MTNFGLISYLSPPLGELERAKANESVISFALPTSSPPPRFIFRGVERETRRLRSLDNGGLKKKKKKKISRLETVPDDSIRSRKDSISFCSRSGKDSIRIFQRSSRTEAKQRMISVSRAVDWFRFGNDNSPPSPPFSSPPPPTRCNFRRFHAASTTIRILIRFFHGGWIIKAGAQPIIAGR